MDAGVGVVEMSFLSALRPGDHSFHTGRVAIVRVVMCCFVPGRRVVVSRLSSPLRSGISREEKQRV
jgi:hypothetical protein